MPAFLTLSNVTLKSPDDRVLCPDLTLVFDHGRTGIVGANGCGKSTLLALLASDHPSVRRRGTVGTLRQDWPDHSIDVTDALGVSAELDRLGRIEAGAGGAIDFEAADWSLPARVDAALDRVSLPPDTLRRRLAELSGGQIMRLEIAKLLLDPPDLLLLDEPTNNLDREGRALIGDLIATWRGGVVVASHDRDLLETMDRIVELTPRGASVHGGGWSSFAEAREAERQRDARALDDARRDLARTRREIRDREEKKARRDRMGRALRARKDQPKMLLDAMKERAGQSAGRESRLDKRLEEAATKARNLAADKIDPARDLRIDLAKGNSHGVVARLDAHSEDRGDFRLGPVDLVIAAGEHVALTGANGAGKSTLLAAVLKQTDRAALLDQHVSLLDRDDTLIGNLRRRHPDLTVNDAHAALARFAFRNTAAERIVGTLSGGETLRAGLAAILAAPEPPDLIVLDEPTNHLDIEAVETLEAALSEFPGALLVVSHDTAFLDGIGIDRWLHLDAGKLTN